MNKKFYFALALTAGLFASCSSDDLTAEAPQQVLDGNETAQITIGVDGIKSYTRGTGSITGTHWGGQQFQLFMYEKGTFTPAQYKPTEADPPVDIFNNAVLTTSAGDSKASYIVGGVEQFNYFPSTGQYDFWAYRVDDAASGAPAANAAGDVMQVPFEINGTQDLMIAVTQTDKAAQALMAAQPGKFADETEAMDKIYSAYSARRGVNPKLQFSHLLTRLTFEVKAATRDVSEEATMKTTDLNEKQGFTITKVKVWSLSKGNINVAYTQGIPQDPADPTNPIYERLEWDGTEAWVADPGAANANLDANLAAFELMSRETAIEKADIIMKEVSLTATGTITPDPGYEYNGSTAGFVPNTLTTQPCYLSGGKDAETGVPTAAVTTFDDARALVPAPATVFVAFVKQGAHPDGVTPWSQAIVTSDASQPLVALKPVVPKWEGYVAANGGTPTWEAYAGAPKTDGYTWTPCAADAAATPVAAIPTNTTVGANVGDKVKYTDALGNETYYELTAIAQDTEGAPLYAGATDPVTDHAAATAVGDIVYIVDPADPTNKLYYHVYAAGGNNEVAGNAVATPVGESMLVAPADDNGYWVEFTYTRTKKITADHVEPMVGTGMINVKTQAGKSFEAGKTYKVTAILYSDGEINIEDIMDVDDTNGTGPIGDYGVGDGDLNDGGAGYGIGDE